MKETTHCVECGSIAEKRYENRIIREGNKKFKIKGIPYYICLTCGEPTYDFHVEVKVEEILDELMEKEEQEFTVNLTKLFTSEAEITAT